MTYNDNNSEEVRFLYINYGKTNFLINKSQFTSSILMDSYKTLKSRLKYFDKIMEYNNEYLPIINFNQFLLDNFNFETKQNSKLVIITDINNFSKRNKKIIEIFYKKNGLDAKLSPNLIGLELCNDSKMENLHISCLKKIPRNLKKHTDTHGVLGTRFNNKSIDYFIDIEKIMFNNNILFAKKENINGR